MTQIKERTGMVWMVRVERRMSSAASSGNGLPEGQTAVIARYARLGQTLDPRCAKSGGKRLDDQAILHHASGKRGAGGTGFTGNA